MTLLRAAVVGAGYLGRFHAQKYAAAGSDGVRLAAVVDPDLARARAVVAETGADAEVFPSHRDILGEVDLASIAAPTTLHHDVARDLLEAGVDVLVEKPITSTVAEADALVDLARARGRILQVGHLERFNKAIVEAGRAIQRPGFIEAHRLGPFVDRGTDVDVVLDLMIHDLDIILALVRSPVEDIQAVGVPVLTSEADIANARITFASGCVANVTASRVSMKKQRKIRVFERDAYLSIDYDAQAVEIVSRRVGEDGAPYLDARSLTIERGDSLAEEIRAFIVCCRKRERPVVSGEDARDALALAEAIRARYDKRLLALAKGEG